METQTKDAELRLEIDRLRLDEELVGQAVQIYTWSKKVADAQLEYDEAKAALDLADAELDRAIRDTPDQYGIAKLTNEVVNQTILLQPDHQVSQKVVNRCKHRLGMAQAAVNGLEHRKRALTLLVDLFTKEYYSEPSRRKELSEEEKEAIRSRGRRRIEREEMSSEDAE